jgi:leucyl/phenylalanyl-tRNA--protein transferase
MPVYRLPREVGFPDPSLSEPDGLLAVGGDLSPERLLCAYALGIFPWYSRGSPILWWSPDPRMILAPEAAHVGRSLRKVLKSGRFEVRADTAFREVISRCAKKKRPGQRGTWITREMVEAYIRLHELGFAHSIEAYEGGALVGGLYGVSLGGAFFGESMFADAPDASKAAFARLCEALAAWGFPLIDCQMKTDHLARFGAVEIPRPEFLTRLGRCLEMPPRRGAWELPPPQDTAASG